MNGIDPVGVRNLMCLPGFRKLPLLFMPIKQLSEKSESFRQEPFGALTPANPNPNPNQYQSPHPQLHPRHQENEFLPPPPRQARKPVVESDDEDGVAEPSRRKLRSSDTIVVRPRPQPQPREHRGLQATISQQDKSVEYRPAFMVPAYFDNILNQNVLLDCGATCSIISEELLAQGEDILETGIGRR